MMNMRLMKLRVSVSPVLYGEPGGFPRAASLLSVLEALKSQWFCHQQRGQHSRMSLLAEWEKPSKATFPLLVL